MRYWVLGSHIFDPALIANFKQQHPDQPSHPRASTSSSPNHSEGDSSMVMFDNEDET